MCLRHRRHWKDTCIVKLPLLSSLVKTWMYAYASDIHEDATSPVLFLVVAIPCKVTSSNTLALASLAFER